MGDKPKAPAAKPAKRGLGRVIEPLLITIIVLAVAHTVAAVADMKAMPLAVRIAVFAAVFPVLPVLWHLWAERRARVKRAESDKEKPRKTTRRERFTFRVLTVTVAAAIGIGAWVGTDVMKALRYNSSWMLPADMRGDTCPALASEYLERLTETGSLGWMGGDAIASMSAASLHERCVVDEWTLDDRRCASRVLGRESLTTRLASHGYLEDCMLRIRHPQPVADPPSCTKLGDRAAGLIADNSDYAVLVRAAAIEQCKRDKWRAETRLCFDIGWRYSQYVSCELGGNQVRLQMPDPPNQSPPQSPAESESNGVSDAPAAASCESVVQAYRHRLEALGFVQRSGTTATATLIASVHYVCEAAGYDRSQRECMVEKFGELTAAKAGDASFLGCKPEEGRDKLIAAYLPDPPLDCAKVGELGAAALDRQSRSGDESTWKSARSEWLEKFRQRIVQSCEKKSWSPSVRACVTIGWRYLIEPMCVLPDRSSALGGLVPEDVVPVPSLVPAPR